LVSANVSEPSNPSTPKIPHEKSCIFFQLIYSTSKISVSIKIGLK
jgi:hypothetical protein